VSNSDAGEQLHHLLWERGLQFLGGQTASQSHEITNVLNIINELVGLQEDLLWALSQGRDVDPSRFDEILGKIKAQIERGNRIVRAVNQFAHSADHARSVFDLKGALERITFIAQRAATLGRTQLDTEFPDETLVMENNPLYLQQAVFTAFEIALAASTVQRRITVSYTLQDDGVEIVVDSADPMASHAEAGEKLVFLGHLLRALGARLTTTIDEEGGQPHRLAMYFPRYVDEADAPGAAGAEPTEGAAE